MNEATADLLQRISELELRVLEADDMLEAINLTVFRQQRQIEQLAQDFRLLQQQMQASTEPASAPLSARDELPPHY